MRRVIGHFALALLALPSAAAADSDGYYCSGPRYTAYQFGLDGGPTPHTLFILRFSDDGTLGPPLQVRLRQFQVHGMRCRASGVDVASFDSIYAIEFDARSSLIRRSVQPLPARGELPEWSRDQRNLARYTRAAQRVLTERITLATIGARRFILEMVGTNVAGRQCTSLLTTRVVALDAAGRETASRGVFRGEVHRECGGYHHSKPRDLSGAQLFNLREDKGESKNVASANPAKVKELADAWLAWDKQLSKPLWGPAEQPGR